MIRCPQCGASLRPSEEELHPTCGFCGTTLRLADLRPGRRFQVPPSAPRSAIRGAVRDHLARRRVASSGSVEMQLYHLPFRLREDGTPVPAFATHVPALARFSLPGSDWKRLDEGSLPEEDIVVAPAEEPRPDEALVYYPFYRARVPDGHEERVLWVDAARGRVLPGDEPLTAASDGGRLARRVLMTSAATFLGLLLVLPLPWSALAAAAAAPLLYRWGLGRLRTAP